MVVLEGRRVSMVELVRRLAGRPRAAAVVVVVRRRRRVVVHHRLGRRRRRWVTVVMRHVHPLWRPEGHDEVLDEPWPRVPAGRLALGTGEVLETHGELSVALAKLVRAGVAAGSAGLAGDWNLGETNFA